MAGSAVFKYGRKRAKTLKKKMASVVTVKRMISNRQELNLHRTNVTGSIPNTMSFNQISAAPQGDADSDRSGDQLYIKSIHWSWEVVGADATNRIRLIIFQWHGDSTANFPTAANLLQDTSTVAGDFGVFRKDTRKSYTVLYDRDIATNTYNMNKVGKVNIYKGFRKKVDFLAGTTGGSGQLFTALISDSSAVAHPSISSQCILRYTDS